MRERACSGVFTGERLVAGDPLFQSDLSRHMAAYAFAREQVWGKRVLDAGCGDGYGAKMLAESAARVVAVDRCTAAISLAARRYRRTNLSYQACDLARLTDLGERFEVVCSFQVIEHLVDPLPFLSQVRAVLEPAGCLLLTTPNREMSLVENPYHIHEYVAQEMHDLLRRVFEQVDMRGVNGDDHAIAYERLRVAQARRILQLDFLNLRRFFPQRAVELIYPLLARVVRRSIARTDPTAVLVRPENFSIAPATDRALDLLALCHLSKATP